MYGNAPAHAIVALKIIVNLETADDTLACEAHLMFQIEAKLVKCLF